MNQNLGHYALVGLVVTLAVHVCVLLGIDLAGHWPVVWVLGIGLFALFVPEVLSIVGTLTDGPGPGCNHGAIPAWVVGIGLGLFAYAFFDFAYFAYEAMTEGNPELESGNFLTVVQGKATYVVALSTYTALRANLLRVCSGYWLFFYFFAFAYFIYWRRPEPNIPNPPEAGIKG